MRGSPMRGFRATPLRPGSNGSPSRSTRRNRRRGWYATGTLDAQERAPDLVIIELGGNDLLRGLSPDETEANLSAMLDILAERDIPVLLMGMRSPPNYGPEFQAEFDALYPALAEEYGADLVPFFLEPVYDQPQLIQPDRIHPTAEGIETLVGATVDAVVEALPEE